MIAVLFSAVVVGAALPEVVQPNVAARSAAELAILKQGITTLNAKLSDTELASRRRFASGDWLSLNFARYTAGRLAELGYATQIVHQAGWPDGVHAWVLAGIPLASGTAWVPVEASPELNQIQRRLGHVPSSADSGGNPLYDPRYISFSEVVTLPPNLPPIANIRPGGAFFGVGEMIKLMALGTNDPDGEIVLYRWNYGDGNTAVLTSAIARYAYSRPGAYAVTMTVIDNGGKSASASVTLQVGSAEGPIPRGPEEPCGCGG